jgi:hypothetical protein
MFESEGMVVERTHGRWEVVEGGGGDTVTTPGSGLALVVAAVPKNRS